VSRGASATTNRILFRDRVIERAHDETVLDALLRAGEPIPHSCRRGTCGSCRMRALSGDLPEEAQRGLKEPERVHGRFLACCCRPVGDLEVELDRDSVPRDAVVHAREEIGDDIVRLRLMLERDFEYAPGQFVNLVRHDGLARSYSLASVPSDGTLEMHVRLVPDGRMSGWIRNGLAAGDSISLLGPYGSCFYVPGRPEQPLVLAGVGTGLAPLVGIARDALDQGHTGPIELFHGARTRSGLYHDAPLRDLARRHANLRYHPCALHDDRGRRDERAPKDDRGPNDDSTRTGFGPGGLAIGPLGDIVLRAVRERVVRTRFFLCGDPGFVEDLRKRLFLAGASLPEIHADPFTPAASSTE